MGERTARLTRTTKETDIGVTLRLQGAGECRVETGYGFADHMLTLLGFWAGFDLEVSCRGDLRVDAHHSLEDIGLCLGQTLAEALGDKAGIARVASARVPMRDDPSTFRRRAYAKQAAPRSSALRLISATLGFMGGFL